MGKCCRGGLDLHFAGIHAPPTPNVALVALFTRPACQTKAKITRRFRNPKQRTDHRPTRQSVAFAGSIAYLGITPTANRRTPLTPALVVFDLDGTLLDTHVDLVESLNHTIAALDLAPVSYDDLTHLVGHGAKVMIERACKLQGHPLEPEALPVLLERFIAHYTESMPGQTVPYPGLIAAMDQLKDKGYRLAVCTNKLEGLARTLLERLQLTHYFDAITGGDTFAVRKPDAAHLLGTIEKPAATHAAP
jgi:2-phosphoglycolate phosphatase